MHKINAFIAPTPSLLLFAFTQDNLIQIDLFHNVYEDIIKKIFEELSENNSEALGALHLLKKCTLISAMTSAQLLFSGILNLKASLQKPISQLVPLENQLSQKEKLMLEQINQTISTNEWSPFKRIMTAKLLGFDKIIPYLRSQFIISADLLKDLQEYLQINNMWRTLHDLVNDPQVKLDIRDPQGTPLLIKVYSDNKIEMVEALIIAGSNLEITDTDGLTLAHYALGNPTLIKLLHVWGANLEATEPSSGWTPLHFAAKKGKVASIYALNQCGANLEAASQCGLTPLHLAAIRGRPESIYALNRCGANLEATNLNSCTPLHLAAINQEVASIHALKQCGSNLEATDSKGRTPLHLAATNQAVSSIHVLKQCGANLEAADSNGWTPLHLAALNAAMSGAVESIHALMHCGANPEAIDRFGGTPLQLVGHFSHQESIRVLKAYGTNGDS